MTSSCTQEQPAASGDAAFTELRPTKIWPRKDSSRVPLWIYSDEDNYRRELERVFYGPRVRVTSSAPPSANAL
jgi:hypothetical protein